MPSASSARQTAVAPTRAVLVWWFIRCTPYPPIFLGQARIFTPLQTNNLRIKMQISQKSACTCDHLWYGSGMNHSNTATKQLAAQQQAIRAMNPEAFSDLKEAYYKTADGLQGLANNQNVLTPAQLAAVQAMQAAFGAGQMKWLDLIL